MRDVSIIGMGQTKVAEHWDRSLRHLAGDAVLAARFAEVREIVAKKEAAWKAEDEEKQARMKAFLDRKKRG